MRELRTRDPLRWLQALLVPFLVGSVAWFVVKTIHWPLTGDASLMHYVTLLMDHGRAPYREIGDINLPLSYAPAWLVGHVFGAGDLPWRFYDLALLAVAGAAMYFIARPYGAFPAVWAGCLFALIHGRDGVLQTGQRDYAASVLLLAGVACLVGAMRNKQGWLAGFFGVCTGAATMIKPTLCLFLLLAFVDYFEHRAADSRASRRLMQAVAGWLSVVAGCLFWIMAKGSLREFWYMVTVVAPYHTAIGHAPTTFLFKNSLSPLPALAGAWLVVRLAVWFTVRDTVRDRVRDGAGVPREEEQRSSGSPAAVRRMLLLGAVFGYASYLVQQRGYPYHRYPLQAFLLLLLAMDFTDGLRRSGIARWLSAAALVWATVVLAPVSAVKAGRYEWREQPFRGALKADLLRLSREKGVASLNRRVQCLDSISGCVATLDAMGLEQATGLMYDEFLFNPGGAPVIDEARASFLAEVEKQPPLMFIVSAPLFPAGPDEYQKLDRWPEFREWLNSHYALEEERTFTVAVRTAGRATVPPGYRIYLRR